MAWPKGKPRNPQLPGASAPVVPPTEAEQAEADAMDEAISDGALTPPKPVETAPVVEASLPHADSIDPKSIKQPVLSQQGWVCPA